MNRHPSFAAVASLAAAALLAAALATPALAPLAQAAAPTTATPAAAKPAVAYPDGYRRWTHVKTMIVEPGHALAGLVEGTHHLYANDVALRSYRGQRPFADGAVIVFDLLTTAKGDRAVGEGPRKAVMVMQKDTRRFAATGGWGYQLFSGATRQEPQLDAAGAASCHGCHTSQTARDFVFSDWRD